MLQCSRGMEQECNTSRTDHLITRIITGEDNIIPRQFDEDEAGEDEVRKVVVDLLHEKPGVFLYRYRQYLQEGDSEIFDQYLHVPDVKHYLDIVTNNLNNTKVIRNRRYYKLQQLLTEGLYFSESEMKTRDTQLHHEMVEQYLTEADKEAARRAVLSADTKFSTFLLNQMDKGEGDKKDDDEEFDSDSEDEKVELTESERAVLYRQFQDIMEERFLNGEDAEFNYGLVDQDERYDDLNIRSRDAEDEYFNDEDEVSDVEEEEEREFCPPVRRPKEDP